MLEQKFLHSGKKREEISEFGRVRANMDVKQAFRQKVNSLMKEIRVAMMSTRHGDSIFSRPMAMQDTEFEGTLYFLTSKKTGKCDDLQTYPKVNLAFSHPGKNNYVSLSGVAELVDDRDKVCFNRYI